MRRERLENSVYRDLVNQAKEALDRSYSPYSHFAVGAALLCKNGRVYRGANVENMAYGSTICAERNAALHAVMDGNLEFQAIAIVGRGREDQDVTEEFTFPCGACRQFLLEFSDEDFEYVFCDESGNVGIYSLNEIMPNGFGNLE